MRPLNVAKEMQMKKKFANSMYSPAEAVSHVWIAIEANYGRAYVHKVKDKMIEEKLVPVSISRLTGTTE